MLFKLSFYVLPNSSENKICGLHDGAYKIKLKAPAVEGAANLALVDFLADQFDLTKRQMTVLHGQQSRKKIIQFQVDEGEIEAIKKTLSAFK